MLRCSLVVLFCLVSPAWLRAEDDWPVPRGPSREPLAYKYDPKAPVPKEFLDAGACVLYSGSTYVVEDDGAVEATTHEITRLNSRKAIERLGEYRSIYFDPTFQKLVLHEARVLKADGKTVPIEPRNVSLRDASTDYFAYNRDKQLVISFPNLQVGDIIEVKWSTRGKNPEFFGKFFTRYTFGDDTYPAAHDELRVRLPKSMPFTYAVLNGKADLQVKDEGQAKLYRWTVTNRPELPQDDYLPRREDLRLQVACSTFESWAAVGDWKTKLRKECWECTPEIKEVVREITKDLTDPAAKARALTYWVRKRIRYVSVSASGSGYTPQLPSRVFANLYGDCKDQSQLLAVMLREAGIDVELITLGALDDGQIVPEVPMPWGTHAILLATIDHRPYWIDTTVTNAPWDFLPRDDRDRIVYATSEGRIRLLRTPALTAADHRYEATTHLTVQPDGTALCKRQATYIGTPALTQRDTWFETAPAERRRLMTAELQDANSRTKLHWLKVDEASLTNMDQPVKAEMEFEIPGHFAPGERDEKDGSVADSRVWSRLLSYNVDYDRQVPLDLGNPFESTHRWVVQLPAAYRFVSIPFDHDVRSPWGHFWVDVQSVGDDQRCTEITFHIRMEKTVVQPADFAQFRKFQEDVDKVRRSWMSIAPTRERSDIPALLTHLLLEPDDSDSAVVLAQLLRNDGQRDKARKVLQVARFFQPQSLPVWEMTVRLAPSLEEQERACRNLVRFFPDQARYCIELGELCVKLNDHAGAFKVLEPLTKHSSDTFKGQAFFELAKSALVQNNADQALDYLLSARAAGAERTRGVDVSLLEGEILERLKKPGEAADAYRHVLIVEIDNAAALGALVRLELAGDRYGPALDYLRRYTLAVEADRDGLVQAGNWYLELGRTQEALELALKAREMKFSAATQRLLGMIYVARGQADKAVLHLSRANLDPEVLQALMRGYLELGRLRDAVDLVPYVEQFKDAPKTLGAQAAVVRELGELRTWYVRDSRVPLQKRLAWSTAIDAFLCADLAYQQGKSSAVVEGLLAKAFEQPVDCAPALALRGLMELERGRLVKALADAEHALKIDAWEARGYLVRGRVRLERLDERALSDLQRAAHLTRRGDAKALHWLAAAEHQAGQDAAALATQAEAAKLQPHDPEIAEQLKEFQKLQ
jgi:tetratricopeptide (TPR) repeat protein/transglutaminase-like putative cysteine protease